MSKYLLVTLNLLYNTGITLLSQYITNAILLCKYMHVNHFVAQLGSGKMWKYKQVIRDFQFYVKDLILLAQTDKNRVKKICLTMLTFIYLFVHLSLSHRAHKIMSIQDIHTCESHQKNLTVVKKLWPQKWSSSVEIN